MKFLTFFSNTILQKLLFWLSPISVYFQSLFHLELEKLFVSVFSASKLTVFVVKVFLTLWKACLVCALSYQRYCVRMAFAVAFDFTSEHVERNRFKLEFSTGVDFLENRNAHDLPISSTNFRPTRHNYCDEYCGLETNMDSNEVRPRPV